MEEEHSRARNLDLALAQRSSFMSLDAARETHAVLLPLFTFIDDRPTQARVCADKFGEQLNQFEGLDFEASSLLITFITL